MQDTNRTFVIHLPYFYRNGKTFKANAFTSQEYSEETISKMVNNNAAAVYIAEGIDFSTKDMCFEVGKFVDARFARTKNFNGGVIDNENSLSGVNTISTWNETEVNGKQHLEHKTFVVNVDVLFKTLNILGVDASLRIDDVTNEICALHVHKNYSKDQEDTSISM